MKRFFYIMAILVIAGCSSKNVSNDDVVNSERSNFKNNITCELKGIRELDLDEETVYYIANSQYIDTDTGSFLTFLNTYNQSIYFYDDNTGKLINKRPLDYKFPIPRENIEGYLLLPNDSLILYSYNTGNIYCCNNSDVLYRARISHRSKDTDEKFYPYTYSDTYSPIMKYGNKIITPGWLAGEPAGETKDNRPVLTIFEEDTKTRDFAVNYPAFYSTSNWGGGFAYRKPSCVMDPNSVIVSFSASHDIIRYSLEDGQESSYYAGSEKIQKITPFSYPKGPSGNEDKVIEWYMSQPSYEGIFYDRYRGLFYRIARLPDSNFDGNYEDKNNKPIVIIVLDSNYKYSGEVLLPKDVYFMPGNSFVTKDGLNMQVLTDNEDKLTYYQYAFSHEKV